MSTGNGVRESRADLTLGLVAVAVAIVLGAITYSGLPRAPDAAAPPAAAGEP